MRPTPPHSLPGAYRLPWQDRLPGPLGRLATVKWWQIGVAVLAGLLLGDQILAPNSRIIKALAGLALFVLAYRAKPFYSLCFITLFFMFPFSIFIGSSTMIFIGLLSLIYLARLALGQVPPIRRSAVDIPMGVFVACYTLSFYNIQTPEALSNSFRLVLSYLATWLLFYQTSNLIRTEAQLRSYVRILMVAVGLAIFVAMWELAFPGRPIVPGWILFWGSHILSSEGYRVKGPFNDYELFGEFMAMVFFLTFFVYRRAASPRSRFLTGGLCLMTVFVLMGTVTRGATLAFLGGLVYFTWCLRKRLKPKDVMLALASGLGLVAAMEFVVANFTRSGSVLERLLATKFVNGVPDSRTEWVHIFEEVLKHPVVGHGPYYDLGLSYSLSGKGLYATIWPHCQYLLYAHTIGFLGVAAFLWLTLRLLWISHRTKAAGLREASYPRSLMIVLHVMLLVFLVDEIKIDYLRNDIYMYFPWILMGLISATYRIIRDQDAAARAAPAESARAGPG